MNGATAPSASAAAAQQKAASVSAAAAHEAASCPAAVAAPSFGLTPELLALQREAREFALSRLRPRSLEREWHPDARQRVDWELVEEASARGWRTMGLRDDATVLGLCVLIEELAYGDMGFAVIIDQTLKVQRILQRIAPGRSDRYLDRLRADPRMVLAICFTEPENSTNYILDVPGFCFRTRAEPGPNGSWTLNGFKRYISNGADAGMYVVFACTDPDQPAARGTSAFLVEPDLPGVEVVEIHEKISQRTINNAAIRFRDVRLGPERLLGAVHAGYSGAREILKESAIEAGATTLGTARAAYELAVEHANVRIQGGSPLIEHANIACRLGEMFAELEAARSLIWRAACAVDSDPAYDHRLGAAAKLIAGDTAMRVCLGAAEIHGGLAIMMRDSPVSKFLRDCLSFLHSDGAQDAFRLRIAQTLKGMSNAARQPRGR